MFSLFTTDKFVKAESILTTLEVVWWVREFVEKAFMELGKSRLVVKMYRSLLILMMVTVKMTCRGVRRAENR